MWKLPTEECPALLISSYETWNCLLINSLMVRLQINFYEDHAVIDHFQIETKIQCTDSSMAQSMIVQTMPEISYKPAMIHECWINELYTIF